MKDTSALRRRIAPSVPLAIELLEDGGEKRTLNLRLAFDFNVCAMIEEKFGVNVLDAGQFLSKAQSPKIVSGYLWASLLPHQPEYDFPDGLAVVRSYMAEANLEEIWQAILDAYLLYCPEKKRQIIKDALDKSKQELSEKQNPTLLSPNPSPGSSSGQSPESTSASASESSAA